MNYNLLTCIIIIIIKINFLRYINETKIRHTQCVVNIKLLIFRDFFLFWNKGNFSILYFQSKNKTLSFSSNNNIYKQPNVIFVQSKNKISSIPKLVTFSRKCVYNFILILYDLKKNRRSKFSLKVEISSPGGRREGKKKTYRIED